MRGKRFAALTSLVGVAALLFVGSVPVVGATLPTAAACQVLADQYGGIAGTPNTTFFPGSSGVPALTDGEVVELFQQICPTSSFGQAFDQHGGSAFGIGESGDSATGYLVVGYTFNWQSSCPPAQASSGECTFQENWEGWPSNNTTAGPSSSVRPSLCSCGMSAGPASNLPLVVGLGAAVGAAVSVVVMARRHRRRRSPNGTIAKGGTGRDPMTPGPPGPGAN